MNPDFPGPIRYGQWDDLEAQEMCRLWAEQVNQNRLPRDLIVEGVRLSRIQFLFARGIEPSAAQRAAGIYMVATLTDHGRELLAALRVAANVADPEVVLWKVVHQIAQSDEAVNGKPMLMAKYD